MIPNRVFVSYSHKDSEWMTRLTAALHAKGYPGELDLWEDTRIRGGDLWRGEIEKAIESSRVAVLLISQDFIDSNFITDTEIPRIFQARIGYGTKVVPVILGRVRTAPKWLQQLQRLPAGSTTLTTHPDMLDATAQELLTITRMEALSYLPFPGTAVPRSYSFAPVMMLGLRVHRDDPFSIRFLIDPGEAGPDARSFRAEVERLIRYFLVGLHVPESHIWVNLSPQEPDRIISEDLACTELGRDLLAQDYLLKQFNASIVHPGTDAGHRYWETIHQRTRIPGEDVAANLFGRVWIVPRDAIVTEAGDCVLVTASRLGAELRTDDVLGESFSRSGRFGNDSTAVPLQKEIRDVGRAIFAEALLPELQAELDDGRHFAITRQAFGALILARWYKTKLDASPLAGVAQPDCVPGVAIGPDFAGDIFRQFLRAFDIGVMDFIREDYDPETQSAVPRKYYSGGYLLAALHDMLAIESTSSANGQRLVPTNRNPYWVDVQFVSVDRESGGGLGHVTRLDPGGIDLDLSKGERLQIDSADGMSFEFSPDAVLEVLRRRGRAVVPIIREVSRLRGLTD